MRYIILRIFGALFLAWFAAGCIIVKHDEETDIKQEISLSPKPNVKMSDNLVRSYKGDMISFLPKGWFLVNLEKELSQNVLAVAVNPDYSISAVFSSIRQNAAVTQTVEKEGLFGLARVAMERRERKSGGNCKLAGKYQKVKIGNHEFVKYEYTTTGGAIVAKSAVFISSIGEYYEFGLVPMSVNNDPLPSGKDMEDFFRSFLTSIKY